MKKGREQWAINRERRKEKERENEDFQKPVGFADNC
jgi:hypothetical protein